MKTNSHPFCVYLAMRFGWDGTLTPTPLHYVLYGGTPSNTWWVGLNGKIALEKWRQLIEEEPLVEANAYSGRMFCPPVRWPSCWPKDWPDHITPTVFLASLGGPPPYATSTAPWFFWHNFKGMHEIAAYMIGWVLTEAEVYTAALGAAQLLRTPQFTIWAYNVDVAGLRRLDLGYEEQAQALDNLYRNPLGASNLDVQLCLAPWAWQASTHRDVARAFDITRTTATATLRTHDMSILPLDGDHMQDLPKNRSYLYQDMHVPMAKHIDVRHLTQDGLHSMGEKRRSVT
jgi:hypothetical protein